MVDKLSALYAYEFPDEDYELMALRTMFPRHEFRRATTEKREDFDADGKRTVPYVPNAE